MTEYKLKQLEKERQKALDELLIAECKAAQVNLDSVATYIGSGANVCYKFSECLRWAAKNLNFDLAKLLINKGALNNEIAKTYIAKMCDSKGFTEKKEKQFFEVLDIVLSLCRNENAEFMHLFTPYINNLAVHGKLEKLMALKNRYYLTETMIVGVLERCIIFEIVTGNHSEMLEFVEKHKNWFDKESFDLAVATGDWIVLEYMLTRSKFITPGDIAVANAVFSGYIEVLEILVAHGYKFERKPLFLEKACRAAYSKGTRSLEFLLRHGYKISDIYLGKTIYEHAVDDKNMPLLGYLKSIG